MIKFTCQPPTIRANKIKSGLEILNYRGNEYMQQFGMKVGTDMILVCNSFISIHFTIQ